jgi:hypothetical protein
MTEEEPAMRHPATWTALAILAVVTLIAILAAPADAASPSVTARSATDVTTTSATLHAGVNPHGSPTTYVFEQGTTRAYGARPDPRSAGSGTSRRDVAATIEGLRLPRADACAGARRPSPAARACPLRRGNALLTPSQARSFPWASAPEPRRPPQTPAVAGVSTRRGSSVSRAITRRWICAVPS